MKKYFYCMFGNKQEVTEEQYRLAFEASPTYAELIAGNAEGSGLLPWKNGLLSGSIEDVIDVEAK